ncbi:MAG: hypothetical protein ACI9TY_000270 [Alphaproteobacteria bacterium]|jgi:hypothetical protein
MSENQKAPTVEELNQALSAKHKPCARCSNNDGNLSVIFALVASYFAFKEQLDFIVIGYCLFAVYHTISNLILINKGNKVYSWHEEIKGYTEERMFFESTELFAIFDKPRFKGISFIDLIVTISFLGNGLYIPAALYALCIATQIIKRRMLEHKARTVVNVVVYSHKVKVVDPV